MKNIHSKMDEMESSPNDSCTCGMSFKEAETIFEPLKYVLESCASVGINVFGLFSNSLALAVLYARNLQTLFNKTLFVLAIFDLIFNICDILETIRLDHYDKESCKPMPYYQLLHLHLTPHLIRPLRVFVIISSMYTTVVIAIERYLAVSKPMITFVGRDEDNWKKLAFRISPVIIVSLILTLPKCFEFFIDKVCFLCIDDRKTMELQKTSCHNNITIQVETVSDGTLSCRNSFFYEDHDTKYLDDKCYFSTIAILQWKAFLLNKTYNIVYRNILLNIVTYAIPLLMLFILNWLIYKHIKERRKVVIELGNIITYSTHTTSKMLSFMNKKFPYI